MSDDRAASGAGPRVLVVDDEEAMREVIRLRLEEGGFQVEVAADGAEARRKVESFSPAVVVSDVVMPDLSGVELLRELREARPDLPVILVTAHGTIDTAVEAMKEGATDFLTKPLDHDGLRAVVAEAARRRGPVLGSDLSGENRLGELVGASAAMRDVFRLVREVADTDATVLITGESGTGKELVARTIHRLSRRSAEELVAVNTAAIPGELMESEIFGHEKGAFTGATGRRRGCFELAHRGTLFLDEIAEMPAALQPKLLRVLEDGRVRRLGGSRELDLDVRVLAATNRDPASALEEGLLREDLYYRLSVLAVELPPLRARRDDVPLLVDHFLDRICRRYDLDPGRLKIADGARERLAAHAWPGNVRELRNALERCVVLAKEGTIELSHLPPAVRDPGADPAGGEIRFPPGTTLAEAEKALIIQTLEDSGHNKTEAAHQLGITPRTVYNKLKAWGMQ